MRKGRHLDTVIVFKERNRQLSQIMKNMEAKGEEQASCRNKIYYGKTHAELMSWMLYNSDQILYVRELATKKGICR